MNTDHSVHPLTSNIIGDITMNPSAFETPAATNHPTGFDLDSLRLPANYSSGLAVKKVINRVPVGKPEPAKFFRVREDLKWTFNAFVFTDKEASETYIVVPAMQPYLGNLARAVTLYTAVDRNNNPFLIPVFLPGEDGKWNSWHQSLSIAVSRAMQFWVRIASNKPLGAYDIFEATAPLPPPEWPDVSLNDLLKIAFNGKIIDQPSHPIIRALEGAV